MRVALDTNILAYAEGVNGARMQDTTIVLIQQLPRTNTFVAAQTLGELFNVLTRKAGWRRADARIAILSWHDAFPTVETSGAVMMAAVGLATDHQLSIRDALVLSSAAAAGCRLLLSEDFQEGFTWNGVTVTNPFALTRHPLLGAVLDDKDAC